MEGVFSEYFSTILSVSPKSCCLKLYIHNIWLVEEDIEVSCRGVTNFPLFSYISDLEANLIQRCKIETY
jgi:hypothetical protein